MTFLLIMKSIANTDTEELLLLLEKFVTLYAATN